MSFNLKKTFEKNIGAILFFGFIVCAISLYIYNGYSNERKIPVTIQQILNFDKTINKDIDEVAQLTAQNLDFNKFPEVETKINKLLDSLKSEIQITKTNQNPKTQNLLSTYSIYLDSLKSSTERTLNELLWQYSLQPDWANYTLISSQELSGGELKQALISGRELIKKITIRASQSNNQEIKTRLQKTIEVNSQKIEKIEKQILPSLVEIQKLNSDQLDLIKTVYLEDLPVQPKIPKIQITEFIDSDTSNNRKKLLELVQFEIDDLNS